MRTSVVALSLVVVALVSAGCGKASTSADTGAATQSQTSQPTSQPTTTESAADALAPASATSSLPTIAVSQLPVQAQDILALIKAGGPFRYSQDGQTFGNRERILPSQPSGFYREYTVKKPGSSDRGPWRIVGGQNGSRFWTDDHYATFKEVVQG